MCLFCPTDSQSTSLSGEYNESAEVSHSSVKIPARVRETPWTPVALQSALTKNVRKHPETFRFAKAPKNRVIPLTPTDSNVESAVPTELSEQTWEDTSEITSQTTTTSFKTDELSTPYTEDSSETQFEEISTSLNTVKSSVRVHTTMSSFKIYPKKN